MAAEHFTLSYRFGVLVDGKPVTIDGSVTIHQPLSEAALRTALSHAAHGGFPRLWAEAKPKEKV